MKPATLYIIIGAVIAAAIVAVLYQYHKADDTAPDKVTDGTAPTKDKPADLPPATGAAGKAWTVDFSGAPPIPGVTA